MKQLIAFALLLSGCSAMTPPQALHVTTTEVPVAQVNKPYATQLQAIGGAAPYRWRVANGDLPPGIIMTSSGQLSGQPQVIGKFDFTVEVTDSSVNPQANQKRVEGVK